MIKSRQQNDCVSVVSNPEFLREGSAVSDFLDPSRIVIGADDNEAANKVASLYKGLQDRMFFTDPISAECIKYMSNGFLAMKISFINQVARFCDAVGADVISVANGISLDPRIGNSFLSPGPGWGGSCFPKDTDALSAAARYVGSPLSLIEESVRDNRTHQTEIAKLAIDVINGIPHKRPKIAALGLSFKANTDDVRVSPAIKIIQLIAQRTQNCEIFAYDPQANCAQNDIFTRVSSLDEAIDGADVAIILTEWQEFAEISPAMVAKKMRGKNIIDTRYIIPKSAFEQFGIQVFSIGRK
jgi:UDPglucose 6-dehydrogenase